MFPLRIPLFDSVTNEIRSEFNPITNTTKYSGFAFETLLILLKLAEVDVVFLNGSELVENELGVERQSGNPYDDCVNLVHFNIVDMCPISINYGADRHKKVDFVSPALFREEPFSFIKIAKNREDAWTLSARIFNTFDRVVWWCIGGCLLVLPVLMSLRVGRMWKLVQSAETVLRLALNQNIAEDVGYRLPERIILTVWMLAALFLTFSFSGVVLSSLALYPGYKMPFSDLKTLVQSGYKFAKPPGLIRNGLRVLSAELQRDQSPDSQFFETILASSVDISFNDHISPTDGETPPKTIHQGWSGLSDLGRICDKRFFTLPIRYSSSPPKRWPNDYFSSSSSFIIHKNLTATRHRLNTAAATLLQRGLNIATERKFRFPASSNFHNVKPFCELKFKTRIRSKPYSRPFGLFMDFLSSFCVWMGGNLVGVVAFVGELVW